MVIVIAIVNGIKLKFKIKLNGKTQFTKLPGCLANFKGILSPIDCGSSVDCGFVRGSIRWFPSSTKLIASECVSEDPRWQSVVFERASHIGNLGEKVFSNMGLLFVEIAASVEILGESCFSLCSSLSSVTFEISSKLARIERWVFPETGLIKIVIPVSVEFVGEECFYNWRSLCSVAFERQSRLHQVCRNALMGVPVHPTPPTKKCCLQIHFLCDKSR
jgi:hypothetical protein